MSDDRQVYYKAMDNAYGGKTHIVPPIPILKPPLLVRLALWVVGYHYSTMTIHATSSMGQQNIIVIGKSDEL